MEDTKAQVQEPASFKTPAAALAPVLRAASTLVEECTLVIESKGITWRGMDPSHVALIDIDLPSAFFERFEAPDRLLCGVRIDELNKIVRRATKKDDLTMTYIPPVMGIQEDLGSEDDDSDESEDDDSEITADPADKPATPKMTEIEPGKLKVQFGNRTYGLRTIEAQDSDCPLPKIEYSAQIDIDGAAFMALCQDVGTVSDYLTLAFTGSDLSVSGQGDSGSVEIIIDPADRTIQAGGSAKGVYSLEYIMPVLKACIQKDSWISLNFSDSKPLKIGFKSNTIGRTDFYLAPRVES